MNTGRINERREEWDGDLFSEWLNDWRKNYMTYWMDDYLLTDEWMVGGQNDLPNG
jgi:hypothetical protein